MASEMDCDGCGWHSDHCRCERSQPMASNHYTQHRVNALKGKRIEDLVREASNYVRIIFDNGEELRLTAELNSTPAGVLPIIQVATKD